MGIWIRSQDKQTLVNIDGLYIASLIKGIYIVCSIRDNKLGRYSSKEKALKVVDMIQQHIEESMYINDIDSHEHAFYPKEIFQMPRDDEIKIQLKGDKK